MNVDMVGNGADGFANGGAPRLGAVEGPVAPIMGAMAIRAVRLPMEGPGRLAVPGPVSKELLRWACLTSAWS